MVGSTACSLGRFLIPISPKPSARCETEPHRKSAIPPKMPANRTRLVICPPVGAYYPAARTQMVLGCRRLRTADHDPGNKNQDAADHHLKRRREEWRIHVAMADIADDAQLSRHHYHGGAHRSLEARNQKRQSVAESAGRSHQSADDAAYPGTAPSRKRA